MEQANEDASVVPSANPFEEAEHPAPSSNPFGSDHEMDSADLAQAQPTASASTEVSSGNNEAETLSGSSASTNPPQTTAEEQGRYDEARQKMQSEVINGSTTSTVKKRKTPEELARLPTRSYLDETVVPCLLVGMSELARLRPVRPLEYLAKFLLREQETRDMAEGSGDAHEENKHKDSQSGTKMDTEA